MKIESCTIENFGKLSNVHFDFNNECNVILRENGWGKSTLAAFIRAMFYGFENQGKRSVIENERKKFKPWQGGSYGGKLVFETKGIRYEIRRTFGEKESFDAFELRNADTNLISDKFSSRIGEELFHINSESFMKTVFIGQNECAAAGATDDINSRLGRISDATDLNKFKEVDEKLQAAINELAPSRHGRLAKLSEEIAGVRSRVLVGQNIAANIDEIESRIKEYDRRLEKAAQDQRELNDRKTRALKAAGILADKRAYIALKDEVGSKNIALSEARNRFPGEIPSDDTLREWERKVSENRLSDNERRDLNCYERIFAGAYDPVLDVNKVIEEQNYIRSLSKDVDDLMSDIEDHEIYINTLKSAAKRSSLYWRLAGVFFECLGICLYIFTKGKEIANVDTFICGVISAVFGCVLFLAGIIKSISSKSYRELEKAVAGKRERYEEMISRISDSETYISEYLIRHERPGDREHAESELQDLLLEAFRFKNLSDKARSDSEDSLRDILKQISEVRSDVRIYEGALKLYNDALDRLRAFEEVHDCEALNAFSEAEIISLQEVSDKQQSIEDEKRTVENIKQSEVNNLNALKEKYDSWLEDSEKLTTLLNEQEGVKRKYDMYLRTKELLGIARENLTARYIDPIQQGFYNYFELLTGNDPEGYKLDANLDLTVDEGGARRNTDLLSKGYRDLLGFCMRLSMADAMYKGEKPVLILDDPFVNLDDEKAKYASELLKCVAEKYQILYLTCREDRI